MMTALFMIFALILGVLFALRFRSKPVQAPPPKPVPVPIIEEEIKAPAKEPAPIPAEPAIEIQKTKPLPKLAGYSSEIIDMSLQYDSNHKLLVAAAEVFLSSEP